MRQTGFLAACAAYALTHNFSELKRVHSLARRLEAGLEKLGAKILTRAETCMVCCFTGSWFICRIHVDFRSSMTRLPSAFHTRRLLIGPGLSFNLCTSQTHVSYFIFKLLKLQSTTSLAC